MLDDLRHFLLVVEHGTLTEAARHAHLSQPALTAAMQRLERDLGARLLDRGAAGSSLTAAGRELMPRARAAIAAIEDARRALEELSGLRAGVVRLGAGATACTYLLPPVLAKFRAAHPGVRFLLRAAAPPDVLDALERGELDLGVTTSRTGERWLDDPLVLVGAPGASVRGAPFVTFARGSTTRDALDRYFPGVEIAMELGSIAAVKGNVRAGIGIALVSRAAVASDVALGRLVELKHAETPIVRTLSLVHRGKESLPPAAAALREAILASPHGGEKSVARRRRKRG